MRIKTFCGIKRERSHIWTEAGICLSPDTPMKCMKTKSYFFPCQSMVLCFETENRVIM